MIKEANLYMKDNQGEINPKYRQKYHLMPPIGWMNDPNGFSLFKQSYHLFYQYHPYDETNKLMYWGHATTLDFVKWQTEEVALAPDQPYDEYGCFSGTAIVEAGKLYVMYTAVNKKGNHSFQEQAIAVSEDGVHFDKSKYNPVIPTAALPPDICPEDFRDPKLWKKGDMYYCAVVARDEKVGGRMLLYESSDMQHWNYQCDFIQPAPGFGTMWECPDIFDIDGKTCVLMSVIHLPKDSCQYWNKQSSVYALGKPDITGKGITDYQFQEIDYGFDFYAPQTIEASDGRRIMTAWMQAWEDSIPTQDLHHRWAGCMILPRELTVENGRLIQMPVREIENYRSHNISYDNIRINERETSLDGINGNSIELELEVNLEAAEGFTISLFESRDHKLILTYDKRTELLTFDRSNGGMKIRSNGFTKPLYREIPCKLDQNNLHLRMFLDTSSIEIFAQKGSITISSRVYPIGQADGIGFSALGEAIISKINKWEL